MSVKELLERLEKVEKEIAVLKEEQLFLQKALLNFIKDEETLIEVVKQLKCNLEDVMSMENTENKKISQKEKRHLIATIIVSMLTTLVILKIFS